METQNEVHFTPREVQVIKLLLLRNHRKKIGIELHIETGTVSNHLKHLFEKTGTYNVSELPSSLQAKMVADGFTPGKPAYFSVQPVLKTGPPGLERNSKSYGSVNSFLQDYTGS